MSLSDTDTSSQDISQDILPRDTLPLLRAVGISKSFPGVRALTNVSIELRAGEVHTLTGENGSGKSTLAKIIGGSYQADEGLIELDGQRVAITSPSVALKYGIVTISQELTLAPTLTVAENIFLGRLPRTRLGVIDWGRLNHDAAEVLKRLNVALDPRAIVDKLSVELQQNVEIARALSAKGRLLILDEATSSLSEAATDRLLEVVEEQRQRGVSVLMITHRMAEVYRSASVATVLRDGKLVKTVPLPATPEADLVRLMVGRELADYYGTKTSGTGKPVMTVKGLRSRDGSLLPTSFELRRGEILGVAGLVGSGKAEFGLCLAGALPSWGEVRVNGNPVSLSSPRTALAGGVALVPDDRRRQAILPGRSVADNFTVAWLRELSSAGLLRTAAARRRVAEAIRRYGVVTASDATHINMLSGGNQQKVVLGRNFSRGCDVYVLSEPTRGIDIGAKSQVYALLHEIVALGASVILISSELPELLGMSDRILVFYQGSVRAEFTAAELDEAAVNHVAVTGEHYTPARDTDSQYTEEH
jgi:ABC-type sugar transport system ATPase subunit